MTQLRKELFEAARAAGDFEYAAWIESRRSMTRAEILPRLAYYRSH